MSSDQEWAELREVERRFLAEDPAFTRPEHALLADALRDVEAEPIAA